MRNKVYRSVLPIALATLVLLFVLHSSSDSVDDRNIRFNGSFVLIDQEKLFKEISEVSKQKSDNDQFLLEIKKLLGTKKYIASFSIRSSWPNTTIINVDEIVPLALINKETLMADGCTVHDYPAGIAGGVLINFTAAEELDKIYVCQQIKKIISDLDPSEVLKVDILENDNYRLFLGTLSFMISGMNVPEETDRLSDVYRVFKERRISSVSIDLRYSSGGAVKPL